MPTFTQTTLGDLVYTISQEHGGEALIAPELSAIIIPTLHQTAEFDLYFRTRVGQSPADKAGKKQTGDSDARRAAVAAAESAPEIAHLHLMR